MDTVIEDFNNIDNVNDVEIDNILWENVSLFADVAHVVEDSMSKEARAPTKPALPQWRQLTPFFQRTSYHSKSSVEIKYF